MADVHSKEIRSYNMSRIKAKDTNPEMLVRKFLFANGFRYRLHDKKLSGKPDIVLPKYKTILFIHGCFWHGHEGCKYYVVPKTRTDWWLNKIKSNKKRDIENIIKLQELGWKVAVLFECQLKSGQLTQTMNEFIATLKKEDNA